jgi:hypothetical protein
MLKDVRPDQLLAAVRGAVILDCESGFEYPR